MATQACARVDTTPCCVSLRHIKMPINASRAECEPESPPLPRQEASQQKELRETSAAIRRKVLLSLSCRRVASCPSRHARVRRCPAGSDTLAAELLRRRHVICRCRALLRLGWRRHRAACAFGAAATRADTRLPFFAKGAVASCYDGRRDLPKHSQCICALKQHVLRVCAGLLETSQASAPQPAAGSAV